MKKTLLAVVAMAMFTGFAHADMMDGQKGVGGQIGYAILGGDAKDFANSGFSIGGHYYQALQNNFAIVPALDYYSFGKKSSGADITNIALSVNGVYNLSEMSGLMPFAFLGLSYNNIKASSSGGDHSDSGIGFNLGVGANKALANDLIVGGTLSYRTFPEINSNSANAIVIGVHVGKKL